MLQIQHLIDSRGVEREMIEDLGKKLWPSSLVRLPALRPTRGCSILDNNDDNPVGILDYVYSGPRILKKASRERRCTAGHASTSRHPPN